MKMGDSVATFGQISAVLYIAFSTRKCFGWREQWIVDQDVPQMSGTQLTEAVEPEWLNLPIIAMDSKAKV